MRPSIFKTTSHSESSEVKIMPDEILTRQVGLMYVPSRPSHYVQNQRICINGVSVLSGLNLEKMYGFLFQGTKQTVRYDDVSVLSRGS